jgi:hypothetical protein
MTGTAIAFEDRTIEGVFDHGSGQRRRHQQQPTVASTSQSAGQGVDDVPADNPITTLWEGPR